MSVKSAFNPELSTEPEKETKQMGAVTEPLDVDQGTATHRLSGKGRFDIAAEFLALHAPEHGAYTQAEARRVLWKIDLRVVPLMTLTVILCAVDVWVFSSSQLPRVARYRKPTDSIAENHSFQRRYLWND